MDDSDQKSYPNRVIDNQTAPQLHKLVIKPVQSPPQPKNNPVLENSPQNMIFKEQSQYFMSFEDENIKNNRQIRRSQQVSNQPYQSKDYNQQHVG